MFVFLFNNYSFLTFQLNEIEKIIEKRTKELETLHTGNNSYSSPTEDMSLRDQCPESSDLHSDTDLPLKQLARLKDKLIRHSRAEDAAVKRIKDLEMQLFSHKQEYEVSDSYFNFISLFLIFYFTF